MQLFILYFKNEFKKLSVSGEITQLLGSSVSDSAFQVFQNGINHGKYTSLCKKNPMKVKVKVKEKEKKKIIETVK